MKKIFITVFLILVTTISNTYSQLPNQNMYLLRNLNQHFTSTLYSAIWGYVAPNGREYAMLGCPAGTAFIDVTDSANIVEVDFLTGPNSAWREMKAYSHYAYIVSEASNSGVQIVDLQYLPDSIHLVKKYVFTGYGNTHSISQEGHYLYLNGGNYLNGGTFVLDVIDPENPVKKGQWETKYVHDCRVKGDTIFACNIYSEDGGTVSVIDASNKDSLRSVTSWANNPNPGPHNCALTTDRKYCLVTDEINGTPRLLKIWDIQNLTNIVRVATWQPTGITTSIVHNVEVYSNFAVIAHYTAGVRVVNISDPITPIEVAWYDTYTTNNASGYNGCWGVYMMPSGKIIASDRQTGLYVLKTNFPLTGTGNLTANAIPENYSLKQNYPNPFNPTTNIKFNLPKNSFVTLKVYNSNGREVANVISDRRDAGNYEVKFDASKFSLSSGTYFYTLQSESASGGFKETKKMILIK